MSSLFGGQADYDHYTWKDNVDHWQWLHDAYGYADEDAQKEHLWRMHCLLELLGKLDVISYLQFYEGIYEIVIFKK